MVEAMILSLILFFLAAWLAYAATQKFVVKRGAMNG
jgi:hypothetical protein